MFELATHLHKFVYEIEQMPYTELLEWKDYLEQRPIGWREDDRTMKLLQAQGVKAKPQEIFKSIAQIHEYENKKETVEKSAVSSIKGSFLYQLMQNASGGEIIR